MEIYIMIIVALAAIVIYCLYTNHQENEHINKLMKEADKSTNNKVRAPWNRK